MKWVWPGWLLCGLTLFLLVYMAAFEAPGISAKIGDMRLPDAVFTGYDLDDARRLHAAFTAELAEAQTQGRQSASAAYVSMHAGSDLLFPPMMAASVVFLAFAGLNARDRNSVAPLSVKITLGIAFAVAFIYLGFDYVENAVADALFGPPSLTLPLNTDLVPVLKVLTIGKYLALAVAAVLILTLWVGALWTRRGRRLDETQVDAPSRDPGQAQ
ncbi:MAG: hypothetical protein RIA09_01880 [Hoeflea sp.]|uniref:hypothetical protein n=1 Tax=Hoeflea sp. TaxID=1940281 RepID=UPI0032EDB5EF